MMKMMKNKFLRTAAALVMAAVVSAALLPLEAVMAKEGQSAAQSAGTGAAGSGTVDKKNEVVYALLDAGGTVDGVYVVNHFEMLEGGTVTDYGAYTQVQNLTSTAPIHQSGDAVTLTANGEKNLYYQGNLDDAALPWTFSIRYSLDGKEISAQALSGQSGKLAVAIQSKQNKAADPLFYENYMLQISLSLGLDQCSNIQAPGAAVASAGKNQQLTYTVMPGSDADIRLEADVENFSLASIDIAAIPYTMSFEITGIDGLTGQFGQLTDAVSQMNQGTGKLAKGSSELKDGSAEMKDGLEQLDGASAQLAEGSKQIQQALQTIASELEKSDLGSSAALALVPGLSQLTELADGLQQLSEQYDTFHSGLTEYTEGVSGAAQGYAKLHEGVVQLDDGTAQLHSGMSQLNSEVAGLPKTIEQETDKLLGAFGGSDFTPVSFTSEKNENVALVQFVISCAGVEAPQDSTLKGQAQEAEETFWDRLVALFVKA